jgi:hypothetical protein
MSTYPVSAGDVFVTTLDNNTTPFPKDCNDRRLRSWLKENAMIEADRAGDAANMIAFSGINVNEADDAGTRAMFAYLFDTDANIGLARYGGNNERAQDWEVRHDANNHHCIVISRARNCVKYIPMSGASLEVCESTFKLFDARYSELSDSTIENASHCFLRQAKSAGAAAEVMDFLRKVILIDRRELRMSLPNEPVFTAPPATESVANKAAQAPETAPAQKIARKRKPSAASMFRELIMTGMFTDTQIFEQVKKAFNLHPSLYKNVATYRSILRSQGANPPAKIKESTG